MNDDSPNLSPTARELFDVALKEVDAAESLRRVVALDGEVLRIGESRFDLSVYQKIYAVAIGKAALKMANSLSGILREKLNGGVISAASFDADLPAIWQRFNGGHPIPNADSLNAAQAAVELVKNADDKNSLIIFLVSGGGSAMIEMPRNGATTLDDLQKTNALLVNCGATIAEVNCVRRAFSMIKGGGLSSFAQHAAQITLLVSDTNRGDEQNIASGLTIAANDKNQDANEIIKRYKLVEKLPLIVRKTILENGGNASNKTHSSKFHVLSDNETAIARVVEVAREKGFIVETAFDLVETPIEIGCAELVRRLFNLRRANDSKKTVCIVSGGEFVCPVRGSGIGGRNLESALRSVLEIEKHAPDIDVKQFALLFAGTDGIDGNSFAAGAIADETTLEQARNLNLNAQHFLTNSDSFTFFDALAQTIKTGATGTNVRDVRILLMS